MIGNHMASALILIKNDVVSTAFEYVAEKQSYDLAVLWLQLILADWVEQ